MYCGGKGIPPTEHHIIAQGLSRILCEKCGALLMIAAVSTGSHNVEVPITFEDTLRQHEQYFQVNRGTEFTTAEVWVGGGGREIFFHGAPVLRDQPDEFYEFAEAVRNRHDIYG